MRVPRIKPFLSGLFLFLTSLGNQVYSTESSGFVADVILTNGKIYTLSEHRKKAEALAIRRGVIIAVGDARSIATMAGKETKVVDLKGKTVLPGFHDMHVHPLFSGLREYECKIQQGSTLMQLQKSVAGCVKKAGKGKWIYGGQWDASTIGKIPDRHMLDVVSPDNPVLLYDTSGHSAVANSRALELAGVTKATPNPEGGIIEREFWGQPGGALRETAIGLVRMHVPPPTDQEIRSALKSSLDLMLSYGITSYTEASTGFAAGMHREVQLYAALADEGILKQRVTLCLNWHPENPEIESVLASRNLYARDRVSPTCIKMFLDGVPTDSHTAAMLEPYEDTIEGRDDEASRRGLLLMEQTVLNNAVTRFDRMGLKVKFHSAGDAAVRAGLNAIQAARNANGFSGILHDVGHCTFVAKKDMPRALAMGATFEVSPYLWSPSPINDSITKAVGRERIKRVWPNRELIESGALVVAGSDWAVVPSVNPWIAIEALVTREEPGGSKKHFGKEQAITLEQAIELFTVNSAKHAGRADRVGRLEAGLLADLVILDRDPYRFPVTDLHKVVVTKTMINGEVVFDRSGRK